MIVVVYDPGSHPVGHCDFADSVAPKANRAQAATVRRAPRNRDTRVEVSCLDEHVDRCVIVASGLKLGSEAGKSLLPAVDAYAAGKESAGVRSGIRSGTHGGGLSAVAETVSNSQQQSATVSKIRNAILLSKYGRVLSSERSCFSLIYTPPRYPHSPIFLFCPAFDHPEPAFRPFSPVLPPGRARSEVVHTINTVRKTWQSIHTT